MKTTSIILALAGALTVSSQTVAPPGEFPGCAKLCGNNMLAQAPQFKCADQDIKCICSDKNFGYGIHDCVLGACQGNTAEAGQLIEWAIKICKDAGVELSPPAATVPIGQTGSGNGSGSGSASGVSSKAISTVTELVTLTSGSEAVTSTSLSTVWSVVGGAVSSKAISTATELVTLTSGSEIVTSTSLSTVWSVVAGAGGAGGETQSAVTTSTYTSVISSGSVVSTITGETTILGYSGVAGSSPVSESGATGSASGSASGSGNSASVPTTLTSASSGTADVTGQTSGTSSAAQTSRTSTGLAAQMTAAPIFGFLAAAGMAAALL